MTTSAATLTRRLQWRALEAHYRKIRDMLLRALFAGDPGCGESNALIRRYRGSKA
jgi:hypothetical protein